MAGTGFCHNGISSKNCRSHSASSPALSKVMNSDSIVKRAIHVCLKDFQDTAAPPRVNTYPLVDFDLRICNPISITVSFKYKWILSISQGIFLDM